MINSFVHAHLTIAALMLAAILALSGYVRFRLDKGRSLAGISSWIVALLILSFALSRVPSSGAIGILVLIAALSLGTLGIRYMYKKAGSGAK
jgi:hypothetical protein